MPSPSTKRNARDCRFFAVDEAQRKGLPVADPEPPLGRSCVVGDMRLHFLDWQGDAPVPMLLLHGALLNAHVWDFFSLGLRDEFRIRALDLPGHGDSAWAADGDYTRARASDVIVGLIRLLDLHDVVLIGHSFGGSVSALVAARLPERVRAIVLVDSTLLPSGLPSIRGQAAAGPTSFATLAEFADFAAGLSRRRGDPERLAIRLRWNARQLPDGGWTWKYDPALRDMPRSPDFDDVWTALRAYTGPALFIRAGERSHLTEEAAARLRALPNMRLVDLPNTGHNVMGDDPVAFRRAVDAFLTGRSARGADPARDGRDAFRDIVADAG